MGEGRDVKGQQAVDEVGVVLQIALQVGGTVPPGAEQAAVHVQGPQDERRVALRRLAVPLVIEDGGGLGQCAEREAVPGRQHLIVGGGGHALGTRLQQAIAHGPETVEQRRTREPELPPRALGTVRHVQDVAPLEVAGARHAVVAAEHGGIGAAEQCFDLGLVPQVVPALHALAVRVLRRVEAPVRMAQVAQQVPQDLPDHRPVDRIAVDLVRGQIGHGEQRVVVQHLLEVRHQPPLVGRVAREAASQVVVHAAAGHPAQRVLDHVPRVLLAGAGREAQQELQRHRLRKLRRATEATVLRVEARCHAAIRLVHRARAKRLVGRRALGGLPQAIDELARALEHSLAAVAVGVGHGLEHLAPRREAGPIGVGEVGPAVEGPSVRREEHVERPAAAPLHELQSLHVDGIDVRALLAVDLDGDE